MSWKCPECENNNEDYLRRCVCGHEDESGAVSDLEKKMQSDDSSFSDLSISIFIMCTFYLFQFLMSCLLYDQSILDDIGESLGALLFIIAIPLIVALIAKLALKKHLLGAFWKALLFFGIPLQLLVLYGGYIEYTQK